MKSLAKTTIAKNQRGFTLTEVVVSAVVFATAVAGLITSVRVLSKPATESSRDVQAVFAARSVIDELRGNMTADLWDNSLGPLAPGVIYTTSRWVEPVNYVITYEISDDVVVNGVKELLMNVTWD